MDYVVRVSVLVPVTVTGPTPIEEREAAAKAARLALEDACGREKGSIAVEVPVGELTLDAQVPLAQSVISQGRVE